MRNQVLYSLLGMAVLFLVNGCTKANQAEPVLELSQTTVAVGAAGGSGSVSYKVTNPVSGAKPSVKAETNDWVSDIAVSDNAITFDVAENKEMEARSVKLTVSYTNAKDVEFTIEQEAAVPVPAIVLEDTEYIAAAEGGACSVSYTIENPAEGETLKAELLEATEWLSNIEVTSSAITFDVAKNRVEESRSTSITLSYEGAITVDLTVTQEAAAAIEYTLNDNWTVTYDGKTTEEGIAELVSVKSSDSERYFISVCPVADYDEYGIKVVAESELAAMEYYYGQNWYTQFSYTGSATERWNVFTPGVKYYALAIGIAEDGSLSGLYQLSAEFEPEQLEASDAYKKWLGTWRIEDAKGVGFDIELVEYSPEVAYLMTGWQPDLEVTIPVSYDYETGGLLFSAVNDLIGEELEFDTDDGSLHPALVGFHGAGDDGYMWPGYDMAAASFGADENTATVTGFQYDFSSQGYKPVEIVNMQVMAVATDGSNYVWTFKGDIPAFPLTMTRTAASGTTAKTIAKPSRYSDARNSGNFNPAVSSVYTRIR